MRSDLSFDNTFVRTLPGDPSAQPGRRQVLNACYSRVQPTPVAQPKRLAYSPEVAELVGLSKEECESAVFAEVLGGNRVLAGMEPYAACYGGHQFGNWAGQLGDGRAITLGERVNARGERWELQLKGAGPTPYSRTADGRAVVRSSVREFLCSEAMHHLGVPTTRALSLVATGDPVMRDMFYDGHPQYEPGAVVCRVAPSFVRFGNFEIFASRNDTDTLKKLADYVIATHYPHLGSASTESEARDRTLRWFEEIATRTARMVTDWMRVGFVHGVMNTDNMSILGLTIDYGPYGWLEPYDLDWTPNTTDAQGRRYRYGHQPRIAWWNVTCLANALLPLVGSATPFQAVLEAGAAALGERLQRMMSSKLGLRDDAFQEHDPLVEALPRVLHRSQLDMTIFFRKLAAVPLIGADEGAIESAAHGLIRDASYIADDMDQDDRAALFTWLSQYAQRVNDQALSDDARRTAMNAINPKYVLRNYLAQLAIDKAEKGDGSMVSELLDVLRRPYDEQPENEHLAARRPDWARHRAGCSMLSCSS